MAMNIHVNTDAWELLATHRITSTRVIHVLVAWPALYRQLGKLICCLVSLKQVKHKYTRRSNSCYCGREASFPGR